MSQAETNKLVEVKVYVKDGVDYLDFALEKANHKLNINAEDNQEAIKKMFCDLIPMLEVSGITLELNIDEDYDNKLFREVATSYIADLNMELENVRANILEEQEDDE